MAQHRAPGESLPAPVEQRVPRHAAVLTDAVEISDPALVTDVDPQPEEGGYEGGHRKEKEYEGRRRRNSEDDGDVIAIAEPADAATEVAVEEEGADQATGPLEVLVPRGFFDTLRDSLRTEQTEPQILERAAAIRRDKEPEYGHFGPYANSVGREGGHYARAIADPAVEVARAKKPDDRTGYEGYVLARYGNWDERLAGAKPLPGETETNYYQIEKRVLADLQHGRMPQELPTVEDLEQGTALMVERGLGDLSGSYGGRSSSDLIAAADIMREATLRVPDFNPMNAGLDRLYSRSILLAAALHAESPQWKHNRAGRGRGDHMAEMTYHVLTAAEESIAAMAIKGGGGGRNRQGQPTTTV